MSKNIFGIEEEDEKKDKKKADGVMCKNCVFNYNKFCTLKRFAIFDETKNCGKGMRRQSRWW